MRAFVANDSAGRVFAQIETRRKKFLDCFAVFRAAKFDVAKGRQRRERARDRRTRCFRDVDENEVMLMVQDHSDTVYSFGLQRLG